MASVRAPLVKLLSGHQMPMAGLGTWKPAIRLVWSSSVTWALRLYAVGAAAATLSRASEPITPFLQNIKSSIHEQRLPSEASCQWGIYGEGQSKPGEVQAAVEAALVCGYRHIDCAAIYGNETEVGLGFAAKFADGTVKREDIFVTSKLWNTCHHPENVQPALERTLADLQLNYIDLYLIHWPVAWKKVETGAKFRSQVDEGIDFVDTWCVLEKLVDLGLTRSIGLSNFNSKQIQRVIDVCRIPPSVLQVEIHPFLNNCKLVKFCQEKGITVTAYSPFASPDPARYNFKESDPRPMEDEKVKAIAKSHAKTPAQIILHWLVQQNIIVIPKSVTPERIKSNLDIFNFELTEDEMNTMSGLNTDSRCCYGYPDSEHHPFAEEF